MKCTLPLIYVFLSLILFFHCSACSNINGACKKAAKSDPKLSYKFCVASLEGVPNSRTASLRELGVISIKLPISNATHISSYIAKLLKDDKKFDAYAMSRLQDCSLLYLDAIPTLKGAVHDFKAKDYYKANVEVSSAMDASITCEDGFKEKKGEVSPLTKENNVFFQLTAIALAFTNMFP